MAKISDEDRERIQARRQKKHKPVPHIPGQADVRPASGPQTPGQYIGHFFRVLRGWGDALFFAFLLAMFIRTYVFELFMIPTGSMTPTLIGDDLRHISEFDWDEDGDEDIIVMENEMAGVLQVHLREADGQFGPLLYLANPPINQRRLFAGIEKGKGRRDMIMVNKFSYWFTPPKRGDIAVFKVPDAPAPYGFIPEKPVYIKRVVGLPGEYLEVQAVLPYSDRRVHEPGRLTPDSRGGVERLTNSQPILINGLPVTQPPFDRLHHFPKVFDMYRQPRPGAPSDVWHLSDREVVMLGDNQTSSLDSRYWGPVPLSHLRGKAVLRYLPVRAFGFLRHGGE